jgi:hypothetical protein
VTLAFALFAVLAGVSAYVDYRKKPSLVRKITVICWSATVALLLVAGVVN